MSNMELNCGEKQKEEFEFTKLNMHVTYLTHGQPVCTDCQQYGAQMEERRFPWSVHVI